MPAATLGNALVVCEGFPDWCYFWQLVTVGIGRLIGVEMNGLEVDLWPNQRITGKRVGWHCTKDKAPVYHCVYFDS